jgi:DNA-binding CsgD family transcriptional regulator
MKLEQEGLKSLAMMASRLTANSHLTPAESLETIRIAQGFACKDSAGAANVSPETIRARRKRIYRKLGVAGAGELISALLGMSLSMLAGGEQSGAGESPGVAPTSGMAAS